MRPRHHTQFVPECCSPTFHFAACIVRRGNESQWKTDQLTVNRDELEEGYCWRAFPRLRRLGCCPPPDTQRPKTKSASFGGYPAAINCRNQYTASVRSCWLKAHWPRRADVNANIAGTRMKRPAARVSTDERRQSETEECHFAWTRGKRHTAIASTTANALFISPGTVSSPENDIVPSLAMRKGRSMTLRPL